MNWTRGHGATATELGSKRALGESNEVRPRGIDKGNRAGGREVHRRSLAETEILEAIREGGLRAHRFVYAPGSRSQWHTHEGEQAIFIVAGRGVVKRWGEEKGTEVGPGDWVHVEPGEKHWHGAVPENILIHLAITATGGTNWHESVTDSEYGGSV
jgi:quercetin dioxygenase-like cupin family protein